MTNSLTLSYAVAAIVAAGAVPAAADLTFDNASGGSVTLYGQLSPSYVWVDDGVSTTSNAVDNAHSNSRVGLRYSQPLGQNKFSFTFETGLGLRSSAGVTATSTPKGVDWDRTDIRKVDFALETARYGTFSFGQGSMATDGIAEGDFGGTGLVLYNGIGDAAGGFAFQPVAGPANTVTIGGATPSLDGGRRGRLRYDSPEFSGFTLSVAGGTDVLTPNNNDDYMDIALRYRADLGTAKLNAGLGFSRRDRNGVDRDDTIGSVAVLWDSGVNVTLAAGSRNTGGDYVYGKLGYNADWFRVGQTAVAVDIYEGSEFAVQTGTTNLLDSRSIGIGAVQKIDSLNTEVYLGYRQYELSGGTQSYHDINSILFGARWKF